MTTHFPFDSIRDGQSNFLNDAKMAFVEKKVLFAYAPTGIGKTAAALAGALEAKKEGQVIFFLTSRQSQHAVVVETVQKIRKKTGKPIRVVDMIGKQDMCAVPSAKRMEGREFQAFCALSKKEKSCGYFPVKGDFAGAVVNEPLHADQVIPLGKMFRSCPYYGSLAAAKQADVVVADYNYLFADLVRMRILKSMGFELGDILLIVDEAHNLSERIRRNETYRLNTPLILSGMKEARKAGAGNKLIRSLQIMEQWLKKNLQPYEKEKLVTKEWFINEMNRALEGVFLGKPFTFMDVIAELQALEGKVGLEDRDQSEESGQSSLDAILAFCEKWINRADHYVRLQKPDRLEIVDLDPGYHAHKVISKTHGTTLMSGTLYPSEDYSRLLGFSPEKAMCRAYDSPFLAENQPIYYHPHLHTRYTGRSPEMLSAYAQVVDDFCQHIPGNVAVFFPSYDLLAKIKQYIQGKRKVLEETSSLDKEDLREWVDLLSKEKNILLLGVNGGSLSEGIDFTHNSIKAVLMVGLPLSPPNLELQETISFWHKKHGNGQELAYYLPAMNKVLQGAGRAIRSEKDKAIVVLLDQRFMEAGIRKMLPKRYHAMKELPKDVGSIVGFFGDTK